MFFQIRVFTELGRYGLVRVRDYACLISLFKLMNCIISICSRLYSVSKRSGSNVLWLRISVSTLLKKMLAKATVMFVSMASFPGVKLEWVFLHTVNSFAIVVYLYSG